ncbi:MAG: ABC transporter permease [Patescibacteria group bacterium]
MREILTVWKKELIDTLRDRRTLYTAVIMPILLMPLIMVGSFKLQESQIKKSQEQEAIVAVVNRSAAPELVEFLQSQDKIKLSDVTDDLDNRLKKLEIQSYIVIPQDYGMLAAADEPIAIPVYEKSIEQKSSIAAQKVTTALTVYNQMLTKGKLDQAGLDSKILQNIIVEPKDLSSDQEKGGFFLGMLLPMFIVLFSIVGGMYVAIDVSAGEKERKTLEALLVTPLSRLRIVTGKFLAVATTSIVSVVLSVTSMFGAFKIWPPNPAFGIPASFNISITTAIIMLGIGIILSIMFAALLLAVAIFAKSFKEAQNYITPFYLLAILPVSIFSSIPGFKPPLALFFIPSVNAVFLFKENLMGEFIASHIIITVASTILFAIAAIVIATKIFSRESVLFRD